MVQQTSEQTAEKPAEEKARKLKSKWGRMIEVSHRFMKKLELMKGKQNATVKVRTVEDVYSATQREENHRVGNITQQRDRRSLVHTLQTQILAHRPQTGALLLWQRRLNLHTDLRDFHRVRGDHLTEAGTCMLMGRFTPTGSSENSVVPSNVSVLVSRLLSDEIVHSQLDGLLRSHSDQVCQNTSTSYRFTPHPTCKDQKDPPLCKWS